MNKKLLLSLLTLFALCSFLGCTIPTDLITTVPREESIEPGAESITLWTNDFEDWNNALNLSQKMDFNDILNDGIQVNQVFIEVDSFEETIRSARETETVPDIYMISYGNLYKEIQNGYISDLTSLFPAEEWADLYDSAKTGVMYNGKYYGYPILMEPSTLLFYRKDLLQQYAGTTEIPSTWNEFVALCATIRAGITASSTRGVYAFDVPKGVALAWGSWGTQTAATGGLAITEDWSASRLQNSGYTDLANLWQTLYTNRYVPLSSGDYSEIINDLCLGKLVMATAGSWSIATIATLYPELINNIGVSAMPTFDGNENVATATNGGWVYVISSTCKNPVAAAKVIQFLVGGDGTKSLEYLQAAFFSKSSPRVSVQTQLLNLVQNQTVIPAEWISEVTAVASKAPMEPIYAWDISVAVASLLENAALGNDISSEISKANTAVQTLISSNNLANHNPRG